MRFVWSEKFKVGVEELDRQHRHLFDLGNRIEEAGLDDVTTYVSELYAYIREHFQAEEGHMQAISYPRLGPHCELHTDFCRRFHAAIEAGFHTEKDFADLRDFLHDWLINHVLTHDLQYMTYAQEKEK